MLLRCFGGVFLLNKYAGFPNKHLSVPSIWFVMWFFSWDRWPWSLFPPSSHPFPVSQKPSPESVIAGVLKQNVFSTLFCSHFFQTFCFFQRQVFATRRSRSFGPFAVFGDLHPPYFSSIWVHCLLPSTQREKLQPPSRKCLWDELLPALHYELEHELKWKLTGKLATLVFGCWLTVQNDPALSYAFLFDNQETHKLENSVGFQHTIKT